MCFIQLFVVFVLFKEYIGFLPLFDHVSWIPFKYSLVSSLRTSVIFIQLFLRSFSCTLIYVGILRICHVWIVVFVGNIFPWLLLFVCWCLGIWDSAADFRICLVGQKLCPWESHWWLYFQSVLAEYYLFY